MAEKRDYYEILGINKNASEADIKAAYRKMALKYHPDRNQGDKEAESKFKEINEAYEVLKDAQKKNMYDQFGHAGVNGNAGPQGGGFGGFGGGFNDFNFNFGGGSGEDIFEDILGGIFGGGSRRQKTNRGPKKGDDLQYNLRLKLSEVAFGAEKEITFEHLAQCDQCSGSGKTPNSKVQKCSHCGGQGQIRVSKGFFTHVQTCPYCQGKGETIINPCENCKGTGIIREKKKISVKVPAGVDNGSTLRLRNEGNAGERGGEAGDLFVVLEIFNDTKFKRENENLFIDENITVAQSILGAEIEIETIDGKATMKIPSGTQPETVFRLKEKGLPVLGTKRRGDLFIKIKIVIPKKLNDDQRKKLIEFAKSIGENVDFDEKEGFIKKIFK
jgi:molecular chaperone DnaJ